MISFWYQQEELEHEYKNEQFCYTFRIDYSSTGINRRNTNFIHRSPYFDDMKQAEEWFDDMKVEYENVMINPELVKCVTERQFYKIS